MFFLTPLLLLSFIGPYRECAAQSSTQQTNDRINEDRARDARNASTANTPGGMTQAQIDELARKLAAGFKRAPREATPTPYYEMSAADTEGFALGRRFKQGDMSVAYDYGRYAYWKGNKEASYKIWMSLLSDPLCAFEAGKQLATGDGVPADVNYGRELITAASSVSVPGAAEWLKANPFRASTLGEFPSMLDFVDGAIAQEKQGVKPLDPKIVGTMQHPKSKDKMPLLDAARAYLWGVGTPVDMAMAEKAMDASFIASNHNGSEYFRTILAWWRFLNRANDAEGFDTIAKYLNEQDPSPTSRYMMALLAATHHDPSLQRYYLAKALETSDRTMNAGQPGYWETYVDLAVMQLTGEGGPVEERAGVANLQLAAPHNANAKYVLARLYREGGHGIAKDAGRSAELMNQAAREGQPLAAKQIAAGETAAIK